MYYIYGYFENDIPFYIGKGSRNRIIEHFYQINKRDYFHNKLRGMIKDNIPFEIKIIQDNLTEQKAFELEILLIQKYGRRDIGTGILCNQTDGGEGKSGSIHSTETKVKMSLARKGVEFSIEHRLSMSRAWRPRSKESIGKMRETSIRERGCQIESYDLKTNITIKKFCSIREADRNGFDRTKVSRVLKGQYKRAYGFGWRYTVKESDIINPNSFALQPFNSEG
jgi:hypothetical protein